MIIVPKINMPSQVYSWRHADKNLIADCDVLTQANVNNAILNPLYENMSQYITGVISETVEWFFPNDKVRPIIHVGG